MRTVLILLIITFIEIGNYDCFEEAVKVFWRRNNVGYDIEKIKQ